MERCTALAISACNWAARNMLSPLLVMSSVVELMMLWLFRLFWMTIPGPMPGMMLTIAVGAGAALALPTLVVLPAGGVTAGAGLVVAAGTVAAGAVAAELTVTVGPVVGGAVAAASLAASAPEDVVVELATGVVVVTGAGVVGEVTAAVGLVVAVGVLVAVGVVAGAGLMGGICAATATAGAETNVLPGPF